MNIPEKNYEFVNKISTALLKESEEFKSSLQSAFPDIYADIESASTNPNCTCVGKVERKIDQHKDTVLQILNNFIVNKDGDTKIEEIINTNYEAFAPKSMRGKMFMIENTEEQYAKFVDYLVEKRFIFKGFSTAIDSNNNLFIYLM